MTRRFLLLRLTAAGLALPPSALLAAGCAMPSTRARQNMLPPPATTQPAGGTAAQQAGMGNIAAQAAVDAPGWKAIEYHTDLPWKAVVVLVSYVAVEAVKQSIIVYLSHRREMRRISNGRNGHGSLHVHS